MTGGNVVYEAFKISLVYLYSGKVKEPLLEICICVDHSCVHNACHPAIDFAVQLIYVANSFHIL